MDNSWSVGQTASRHDALEGMCVALEDCNLAHLLAMLIDDESSHRAICRYTRASRGQMFMQGAHMSYL